MQLEKNSYALEFQELPACKWLRPQRKSACKAGGMSEVSAHAPQTGPSAPCSGPVLCNCEGVARGLAKAGRQRVRELEAESNVFIACAHVCREKAGQASSVSVSE
jgi:hypothetical protein